MIASSNRVTIHMDMDEDFEEPDEQPKSTKNAGVLTI
jgi:hypothetical protein